MTRLPSFGLIRDLQPSSPTARPLWGLPFLGAMTMLLVGLAVGCRDEGSTLEVHITDGERPLAGVAVTLRAGDVVAGGSSDEQGTVRLIDLPPGPLSLEALLVGEEQGALAVRELPAERPAVVHLDLQRDFRLLPAHRAYERSEEESAQAATARLRYDLPELDHDRRVDAVIEIDSVAGMDRPQLAVETAAGRLTLQDVLAAVGISATVVWDDTIPAGTLVWPPEEQQLQEVMQRYHSVVGGASASSWHCYLLLAPLPEPGMELSLLIDPDTRSGAVVYLPPQQEHPGAVLHAVVHELGHLLNLPHPWEVYGNTRSAMSYPWRWQHWDWTDPRVYHFDNAGRHHILRGPETLVRPGAGPFQVLPATETSATR